MAVAVVEHIFKKTDNPFVLNELQYTLAVLTCGSSKRFRSGFQPLVPETENSGENDDDDNTHQDNPGRKMGARASLSTSRSSKRRESIVPAMMISNVLREICRIVFPMLHRAIHTTTNNSYTYHRITLGQKQQKGSVTLLLTG